MHRLSDQSLPRAAHRTSGEDLPRAPPVRCCRADVSRVHDFLSSSNVLLAALRLARVPRERDGSLRSYRAQHYFSGELK